MDNNNPGWFVASELIGLPGLPGSDRRIRERAKKENWKSRKRKCIGGGTEYCISNFSVDSQAILLNSNNINSQDISTKKQEKLQKNSAEIWSTFDAGSNAKKKVAQSRLNAILKALEFIEIGEKKVVAFQLAALEFGFNKSTLYRWFSELKNVDRNDWLPLLIPQHKGSKKHIEFTPEAFEFFKFDYLRLEQPEFRACFRRLEAAAKENNWIIPSEKTIARRLNLSVSHEIQVLKREGRHAVLQLYPHQKRTIDHIPAMEYINGDGYQHNVFVVWPDGEIKRPKTWFWQDLHSRKMVGYRTDKTENTDVIRMAFGDVAENYGIPKNILIDNTRAAANKWLTGGIPNRYRFKVKEEDPEGLFKKLGIEIHWSSVQEGKGMGQVKPIERAFGVGGIGEVVDKHPLLSGAYTGPNPTAKPDNYGSKAIPLKEFLKVLDFGVAAYNSQKNRQTEMCRGVRSFDEAFEASYSQVVIKKPNPEQLRMILLAGEQVKVRQGGFVHIDAGKAFGVGQNRYRSLDLIPMVGQRITIQFDPLNLHRSIYAYTKDGRYIGEVTCEVDAGFDDARKAREHDRLRKGFVRETANAAKKLELMNQKAWAEKMPVGVTPIKPNPAAVEIMPINLYQAPKAKGTLNDKQQEQNNKMLEEMKDEMNAAPVADVVDISPAYKYGKWVSMQTAIETGHKFSAEELNWYNNWQDSSEFKTQKTMAEDFGVMEVEL
ncbi:Mu transposase C-terminal domain-containing protein [Candidatus Pacearchaeota archaeon]|nr:Mu transposase C-terminal domain-containing protein [Candidatus Pacearchaeota archaeon]